MEEHLYWCPTCLMKHIRELLYHLKELPEGAPPEILDKIKRFKQMAEEFYVWWQDVLGMGLTERELYNIICDIEHRLRDMSMLAREIRHMIAAPCTLSEITVSESIEPEHSNPGNPGVEPGGRPEELPSYVPIRVEITPKWIIEVFREWREFCHPGSIRTIKPKGPYDDHLLLICCPKGEWDEESKTCRASTAIIQLWHPNKPECREKVFHKAQLHNIPIIYLTEGEISAEAEEAVES